MGGVLAAEAVSRLPGPPLKDPPTSPPHQGTGAGGGSAVGCWRRGCPSKRARSVAADVPARLAQRMQRSDRTFTRAGGPAADVPPSDSDWRGGRAGPGTSRYSAARHRAWRVDRGDELAAAQRRRQRRREHGAQFVKRAVVDAQHRNLRRRPTSLPACSGSCLSPSSLDLAVRTSGRTRRSAFRRVVKPKSQRRTCQGWLRATSNWRCFHRARKSRSIVAIHMRRSRMHAIEPLGERSRAQLCRDATTRLTPRRLKAVRSVARMLLGRGCRRPRQVA